jgi:hypothetical protein
MGRLIYTLNVSLDGFVETADHSPDWGTADDGVMRSANSERRLRIDGWPSWPASTSWTRSTGAPWRTARDWPRTCVQGPPKDHPRAITRPGRRAALSAATQAAPSVQ